MNTRKVNSISRALALRINAQRARNIAVGAALVMVPLCSDGQAQPGPGVQWRTVSWADELPETGVLNALQSIDYNTNPCYPQDIVGVHYTQTASQGQSVTQDNSSEDWWYAHVNCYAPGTSTFIGTATVGYSHILNWSDEGDPCFDFPLDVDLVVSDRRQLFETWAYQTGGPPFCTVAFFDPQGVMLWCKVVMPGTFYALCQDPVDGSIIAVGDAAANRTVDALQGHVSPTIHYNPTGNSTDVDISQVTCGAYGTWASKTAVAKFDLQGSMQWLNTYGADVGVSDAWIFKSRGLAVAPLTIDGGHGYLVSGWCNTPGSGDIGHLIRIKADGSVKDQHQVVSGDVPDLGLQSGDLLWLRAIDVVNNGADGIVLTGGHLHGDYWDSYLMTMAPAAYNFQMVAYTRETLSANNMTVVHHTDQHQFSTSAKFTNESGGVHNILWPVLSNYAQGTGIGAGIKHATLIMYKFPNGLHTTPLWSTDLGEVEAYDLQADVVQLADGLSCAVLGTRYSKPYSITNKFMRSSLSTSANACLQQFTLDGDPDPNGADINVPCDNADQEDHLDWNGIGDFEFWNTDAFISKLDLANGAMIWQTQFDAAPGIDRQCYPGDLKKQECMYKITEAPDGGLLVDGNTSNNQDDSYLAKLFPDCQSRQAFTTLPTSNFSYDASEDKYTLTSNYTLSSSATIHGRIVIPAGKQLTINGATVHFADSRQLDRPTGIIVAPQGKLLVNNNATLTSLSTCPNSMWDGIQVLGDPAAVQSPSIQGVAIIDHSTISNSFSAVLAANRDPEDPSAASTQQGGIVIANQSTFLNNVVDIDLETYHAQNAVDIGPTNIAYCHFKTTDALNDPSLKPRVHIAAIEVPKLYVFASEFIGLPGLYPLSNNADGGILAINTTVVVLPSFGNQQHPAYPLSAPESSWDRSTFSLLSKGIVEYAFNPAKAALIDGCVFDKCVGGINLTGVDHARVVRNTFFVPDVITAPLEINSTYGLGIWGGTGWQVQGNHFTGEGAGTNYNTVGLVLSNTGADANTYYNNTFGGLRYGSIIMHDNGGAGPGGLHIKCDDYSANPDLTPYPDLNNDVALTGTTPTIGSTQGVDNLTAADLAGNTFDDITTCTGEGDRHILSENGDVNHFDYYHHVNSNLSVRQLRPVCSSDPIVVSGGGEWLHESTLLYNKATACPDPIDPALPHLTNATAVHHGHLVHVQLKNAYASYADGGDPDGLVGFIDNTSHSSFEVRNQLMMLAPQVSTKAWGHVFARSPAMNPWHIAQALMQNSPLESEVIDMMDNSGISQYYKDLVNGAQNGGTSQLSIMKSEIAFYYAEQSHGLFDMTARALLDTVAWPLDTARAYQESYPVEGSGRHVLSLLMAQYGSVTVEALVDDQLDDTPDDPYYRVMKNYLHALNHGGLASMSATAIGELQSIAELQGSGSAQAQALLMALGQGNYPEEIIIPDEHRMLPMHPQRSVAEVLTTLTAYPNPTKDQVYLVYDLPEGAERAEVRVMDAMGRLIEVRSVSLNNRVADISLAHTASGTLVCGLYVDGTLMSTAKVDVVR